METTSRPRFESCSSFPQHRYKPGEVLAGKYHLEHAAAIGGMGAVWAARNVGLDLPVAIKLLHEEVASREGGQKGLWREARAAASVRHSAIVKAYDFGFTQWNDPFIAMELLEGEPLSRLLAREGCLTPERAVQVMLPVADGLDALHALGIVHRDLKPDNIFLASGDHGRIQPKIVDFGIAKLAWLEPHLEQTPIAMLGTPGYMSPEQMVSANEADQRADVWSFCIVLYELLSGALPFPDDNNLLPLLNADPVPSLSEVLEDQALCAILDRGLSKNLEERWGSMRLLGAALASWLASRGVSEDVTGAAIHSQWFANDSAPSGARTVPIEIDPICESVPLPSSPEEVTMHALMAPSLNAFALPASASSRSTRIPRAAKTVRSAGRAPRLSVARFFAAGAVAAGLTIASPSFHWTQMTHFVARALPLLSSAWAEALNQGSSTVTDASKDEPARASGEAPTPRSSPLSHRERSTAGAQSSALEASDAGAPGSAMPRQITGMLDLGI